MGVIKILYGICNEYVHVLNFQMLMDQKIQWSSRHFYGSSWKQLDITLNTSVRNKMESQCSRYSIVSSVVV